MSMGSKGSVRGKTYGLSPLRKAAVEIRGRPTGLRGFFVTMKSAKNQVIVWGVLYFPGKSAPDWRARRENDLAVPCRGSGR
jgi:hypothetical protein